MRPAGRRKRGFGHPRIGAARPQRSANRARKCRDAGQRASFAGTRSHLRTRLGSAARRTIEAEFDINASAARLTELFLFQIQTA